MNLLAEPRVCRVTNNGGCRVKLPTDHDFKRVRGERRCAGSVGRMHLESAFTLVELLVVIAIIAVLAALLFPAFGRAKESGKGAACISNLRQIGIALQVYAQENNNRLPIMRDRSWTTTNDLPS